MAYYFKLISYFFKSKIFQFFYWRLNKFSVPAPNKVKLFVLLKYSYFLDTWVESGTFKGETTKFLAKKFKYVHTIEPDKFLAEKAQKRFYKYKNIEVYNFKSKDCLKQILQKIDKSVSLWLDGHYSGGETFNNYGQSPIVFELEIIKQELTKFNEITIFIDDFRSFGKDNEYPSKFFLVNWVKSVDMEWTVEHDIFIAYNKKRYYNLLKH